MKHGCCLKTRPYSRSPRRSARGRRVLCLFSLLLLFRTTALITRQKNSAFDVEQDLVTCTTTGGPTVVRSVFKHRNYFDILAEVPRLQNETLSEGCSLTELVSDKWVLEDINPRFSHHDVIIRCDSAQDASFPFADKLCDISKKVSSAVVLETPRKSGVVGCVGPLFGSPAQGYWKNWLTHAMHDYRLVFLYVVGELDYRLEEEVKRFPGVFQVVKWDMLLRTGDLRQTEEIYINPSYTTYPMWTQQIPYHGQYLQMVDCQHRSRSVGYKWFQPTEMDMYMQHRQGSVSSWIDKHENRLQNVDYVYVNLVNRLVQVENDIDSQSAWRTLHEEQHPAPKYIGRTESTCEAGVHHMFGNCSHMRISTAILQAVHVRFNNSSAFQ